MFHFLCATVRVCKSTRTEAFVAEKMFAVERLDKWMGVSSRLHAGGAVTAEK